MEDELSLLRTQIRERSTSDERLNELRGQLERKSDEVLIKDKMLADQVSLSVMLPFPLRSSACLQNDSIAQLKKKLRDLEIEFENNVKDWHHTQDELTAHVCLRAKARYCHSSLCL